MAAEHTNTHCHSH